MFRHTPFRYATLALCSVVAVGFGVRAGYFGLDLLTEIAILAILVVALDLVAGFGGMVSLCHGALMGLGAYGYTLLSLKLGLAPGLAMAGALAAAGGISWVIGAICARAHGIYFIMATLAFGQMGYSFIFQSSIFGGDDGLSGAVRFDFSAVGIDLMNPRTFAFFALFILSLAYLVAAAVLRSGLGRSFVGIMHNEQRMRAIGLNVWKTKAHVFGISGLLAGLAGVLAAQHTMFISPNLLAWTVSGEALVVVILGGLGTLIGPMIGAALFVVLKHEVSALTSYWHLVVGLILIAVVMSRTNGLFGWIEHRYERWRGVPDRPGAQELVVEADSDA